MALLPISCAGWRFVLKCKETGTSLSAYAHNTILRRSPREATSALCGERHAIRKPRVGFDASPWTLSRVTDLVLRYTSTFDIETAENV